MLDLYFLHIQGILLCDDKNRENWKLRFICNWSICS